MKKALLLIDFEKEWIDEKSEYFVGNISEVIEKTNKLIEFARQNDYKIIFTRHIEKESTKEFAPNTERIEIIEELDYRSADLLVSKHKISPFYKTELEKELNNIGEIVICGILTNLCVRSAVQDAYDRDFEIKVVKDCCVSFDKKTHEFTFSDLKATREEVEFLNLDEFLSQDYK